MTPTAGFQSPETVTGQIAYMVYKPHFSKKRGVWVPGAYEGNMGSVVDPNFDAFFARLASAPDVYDQKGKIPSMSPGLLCRGATQRQNKSVQKVTMLVIDLDQGREDLEHVWRRVHEIGVSAIFHTTYSHMHPGKGERWRCLIELTEPIPVKDWSKFWRAAMLMFAGGADGRLKADRACIDPARVYYVSGVAPGYEHTYQAHRVHGYPLPPEDVWEAAGLATAGTATAGAAPLPSGDRMAAIAAHRAMLPPGRRKLSREDLEALAKDKKKVPDPGMRAAYKAAAAGTRMALVKGESRGAVLTEGRAEGLHDGDIDPFLTSLMYRLAIFHRNAEPEEVDALFAQSFALLVEDDETAGNTPYSAGALGAKFATAVHKIDEEEVERAEKLGLPTSAEFRAEHGTPAEGGDDGRKGAGGGLYQGRCSYYVLRAGADGEPVPHPVSNFAIVPRELLRPIEGPELWLVDVVLDDRTIEGVELPLRVFGGTRDFRAWTNQWPRLTWDGSDSQVTRVKGLVQANADELGVPSVAMTSRVGLLPEHGALVYPWGTLDAQTGEARTDGPRWSREADPNPVMAKRLAARPADLDDTRIARAIELAGKINRPEVIEPLLGWFTASLARPYLMEPLSGFPHLAVFGSKNSGKTSMLALLVEMFGGYTRPVQSCINNHPSLVGALHSVTSIPMWMDEYKPSHLRGAHVRAVSQLLREAYDDETRSTVDGARMSERKVEAPILISGEAAPSGDAAATQRCAVVETSLAAIQPGTTGADTHRDAFKELDAMGDLRGMSVRLALFAARFPWAAYLAEARRGVDACLAGRGVQAEERTRGVLTALVAGRFAWQEFAGSVGATIAMPSWEAMCASTLAAHMGGIDGETRAEQDPLLDFLETISRELLNLPIGVNRADYVTTVHNTHVGLLTATCFALYEKARRGQSRAVHDRNQLLSLARSAEYMSKGGAGADSDNSPSYKLSVSGEKVRGLKIAIAQLRELPIDARGLLPQSPSPSAFGAEQAPTSPTLN